MALSPSSQTNGASRTGRNKPAFVEIFARTPTGFTKSQVRPRLLLTDLWRIRNVLWLILSLRTVGDWQRNLLIPSEPCPLPACIQLCLLRSLQLTASYCSAPWKAQAAPEVSFAPHAVLAPGDDCWVMLQTEPCTPWRAPCSPSCAMPGEFLRIRFEESPPALQHENCFLSSPT